MWGTCSCRGTSGQAHLTVRAPVAIWTPIQADKQGGDLGFENLVGISEHKWQMSWGMRWGGWRYMRGQKSNCLTKCKCMRLNSLALRLVSLSVAGTAVHASACRGHFYCLFNGCKGATAMHQTLPQRYTTRPRDSIPTPTFHHHITSTVSQQQVLSTMAS